jgi:hypothetical protein
MSEPTNERLDRIAAILALAHRVAISEARKEIRADALSAAILDNCPLDWAAGRDIEKKVPAKVKSSPRTFNRRLSELVAEGALYRQGKGAAVKYRPTGLV